MGVKFDYPMEIYPEVIIPVGKGQSEVFHEGELTISEFASIGNRAFALVHFFPETHKENDGSGHYVWDLGDFDPGIFQDNKMNRDRFAALDKAYFQGILDSPASSFTKMEEDETFEAKASEILVGADLSEAAETATPSKAKAGGYTVTFKP